MKIEKLNENQIRCTLTREDLASREIRLTELAYGSAKARELFQDMMQQAFDDVGFEARNTPLMIEAIPLSADAIILIITKVESPDELDSRFSRFSPEDNLPYAEEGTAPETINGLDDILDLVSKLSAARRSLKETPGASGEESQVQEPFLGDAPVQEADPAGNEEVFLLSRFYLFRDLPTIIRAAKALDASYTGISSLFKNPDDGSYYLILQKGATSAELFNKVCNVLSEYSLPMDYIPGTQELFLEHMETIIKDRALSELRDL